MYISSYGYSWPGNSWLFCGSMWLRKVPLYLWLPCGLCFDGEAGELSKLVTAVSGSDSLNLADWQQSMPKKKRISFTCFSSFADVSRLWPEDCRCLTDGAAEAPQSLLFVAEVEVFNPNLLGGDSDEGQLHLTYQGHQMGTGKMEPSSVPAQSAVKLQATMNLDLPLDFAAWLHGTTWQTLKACAIMHCCL